MSTSTPMGFNSECGAKGEGHFPTENEAKYRMCLSHVRGKCGAFVRKYEEDLANLDEEFRKNEEEIEKQFSIMMEKLEQRKKDSLERLHAKKSERETILTDAREKLILYEEKCGKTIQEIWQTIQSQEENLAREQQCEKMAKTVALEIPILYSIPYQLKFDPKDMGRINTMISSCGQIQFTELDRKKRIEEFCWRDIDRQWLQPSSVPTSASTATLATPRSKVTTERSETAKSEYYSNRNGVDETKHDDLAPGQSNHEGMDNEADSVITAQVKYKEEEKPVAIPRQEWTVSNLRKCVVQAFSLTNPEPLTFKVTDGTTEENFDLNKYDPYTQTILVVPGEAKPKGKKDRDRRIRLFITYKGRRTKLDFSNSEISFNEFKESIKNKIKEPLDNFTIQIGNGINRNKLVASDADIALLFCGESQLEINVLPE